MMRRMRFAVMTPSVESSSDLPLSPSPEEDFQLELGCMESKSFTKLTVAELRQLAYNYCIQRVREDTRVVS